MRPIARGLLLALLTPARAGESMVLHVEHVSVVNEPVSNQLALKMELTPESKEAFGAFTNRHIGEQVDLKVDGEVIMSPVVREPILGGEVMITGRFGRAELVGIAKRIEAADAKVEAEVHDPQQDWSKRLTAEARDFARIAA
jgi:preprotein translocase subunit SecD